MQLLHVESQSFRQVNLQEVCLQITNTCPLNCRHCSTFGGRPLPQELELAEIRSVIAEIAKLGAKVLQISGGEPFSHPYLDEILSFAKEMQLEVSVYTAGNVGNGSSGIAAIPEQRFQLYESLGLDRIIFSIHGDKPGIHDRITRVRGSFANLLKSLSRAGRTRINSEAHFVPMKSNIRALPGVVKVCEEKELSKLSLLRFVPQGRGEFFQAELDLSPDDIEELSFVLKRILAAKRSVEIRIGAPLSGILSLHGVTPPKPCKAGTETLVIRPDGRIVPCPAFHQSRNFRVGSLRDETLTDTWTNNHRWRRLMNLKSITFDAACDSCPAQRLLRGTSH